jgi:hypothetical protein
MSDRKVFVGAYHIGFLESAEALIKQGSGNPQSKVDVSSLFYATMIQAGVEQFETIHKMPSNVSSDFITSRFSIVSGDPWQNNYRQIEEVFGQFIDNSLPPEQIPIPIHLLKMFLFDLMMAAKRETSIVLMKSLPTPSEIDRVLPPELAIIFKNLLSVVETAEVLLPIQRDIISIVHFQRLKEIICSDLFKRYASDHEAMEDRSINKMSALRQVVLTGSTVMKANRTLLKLKDTSISMIPLTSKVIDTVFGKLPGVLADSLGQYLSKKLVENRRIIIYRFDSVYDNLINQRKSPLPHSTK